MVKLKRLKILKYRNVRPGTELHFDDGVNLILGQNASGKTTLLALISAVCRGDFEEMHSEEFSIEADIRTGEFSITLHLEHRRARFKRAPSTVPAWTDEAKLDFDPDFVAACCSGALDGPKLPIGWFQFWRKQVPLGFTMSGALQNTFRFDESLGAFAAMTGRATDLSGPEVPPSVYIAQELGDDGIARVSYYVPVILESMLLTMDASSPIFQRPLGADDIDLCQTLTAACGVEEVTLKPNFQERRLREDVQFKIEGFTFELTRPDGTIIHHDRLSYGQKRLLAFYYYLACNPAVVIADELVNGLHQRWIDACMKAIGERQAFLTSQNPLLFDYVEFDSVEQVRSRFITCRLEQVDGREQMVWENMSEEDATRFFDAYQAGIEHVGDILITRGMW